MPKKYHFTRYTSVFVFITDRGVSKGGEAGGAIPLFGRIEVAAGGGTAPHYYLLLLLLAPPNYRKPFYAPD